LGLVTANTHRPSPNPLMSLRTTIHGFVSNFLKNLNSGSLYFTSASVSTSATVFVSYGYGYQRPMMEVGYDENVNELSIICETPSSVDVLKPHQTVILYAPESNISSSFIVGDIISSTPDYKWIMLRDRKDETL